MNKDWLDISVLEDYLDGKLDAKTMNRVEREALDDPFVAEALAGLSESPRRSLQSISLLQKQLHERVAEHKDFKKTSVITWQRLSIAAAAAVVFVSVSVMFWMREENYQKQLAGRSKKVDVTIAPVPEVTPPAVQTAPVIASESADVQREKEIDKAVKAAKTNSYAARVKPKVQVPAVASAIPRSRAVLSAAPAQTEGLSSRADDSALNEAVIIGYAKNKNERDSSKLNFGLSGRIAGVRIRGTSNIGKSPMVSNPVGGWDKLWAYMLQNNAFKNDKKVGQTVELSFKIAKNGTPEDIKILKEADHKYEEEAIRLILNGPKWEQPSKEDGRVTFTIDF